MKAMGAEAQETERRRPRPPLAGAGRMLVVSALLHALILAVPLGWVLLRPVEARKPVELTVLRPAPRPEPRAVAKARAPPPPQAAAPVARPQPTAPPAVAPQPAPPPQPVVQATPKLPEPQAPKPPLEASHRRVAPRPEGDRQGPPRPRIPEPEEAKAVPTPARPAPRADPNQILARMYANLPPSPRPEESGPSSGVSDLTDLFNRAGGTPGAARILPLNSRDGYSFRARQEAFSSLGLKLRQFYSDHTLYNDGNSPIQGVRRERGIERIQPRVPAGEVIQIGVLGGTEEALQNVDIRMTRMEEEYLRQQGLLGRVNIHQVEYKVVFGERGYELIVGNILYTPKGGGS